MCRLERPKPGPLRPRLKAPTCLVMLLFFSFLSLWFPVECRKEREEEDEKKKRREERLEKEEEKEEGYEGRGGERGQEED